jgi:uncharacterized protein
MATRYSFPAAEAKYPWLKTVLDTYYISDAQVEEHLVKIAKKGIVPACHKGCDSCCKRPTVPFTEPELTAISWYTSEELAGALRIRVKQQLKGSASHLSAPALAPLEENNICHENLGRC